MLQSGRVYGIENQYPGCEGRYDEHGTWYDIEMQIGEHGFYGKRALYYVSKMYVDELHEGDDYTTLKRPSAFTSLTSIIFLMIAISAAMCGKTRIPDELLDHLVISSSIYRNAEIS